MSGRHLVRSQPPRRREPSSCVSTACPWPGLAWHHPQELTACSLPSLLSRFELIFSLMCCLPGWRIMTLPPAVTLNRLAAACSGAKRWVDAAPEEGTTLLGLHSFSIALPAQQRLAPHLACLHLLLACHYEVSCGASGLTSPVAEGTGAYCTRYLSSWLLLDQGGAAPEGTVPGSQAR